MALGYVYQVGVQCGRGGAAERPRKARIGRGSLYKLGKLLICTLRLSDLLEATICLENSFRNFTHSGSVTFKASGGKIMLCFYFFFCCSCGVCVCVCVCVCVIFRVWCVCWRRVIALVSCE